MKILAILLSAIKSDQSKLFQVFNECIFFTNLKTRVTDVVSVDKIFQNVCKGRLKVSKTDLINTIMKTSVTCIKNAKNGSVKYVIQMSSITYFVRCMYTSLFL